MILTPQARPLTPARSVARAVSCGEEAAGLAAALRDAVAQSQKVGAEVADRCVNLG